jgi:hypothetical protein
MNYPKRHPNQTLEEISNIFFREHAPAEWNIYAPPKDYGQDLNIEIAENNEYRGLELIVQLKSSNEANTENGFERQVFRTSTYNYLNKNLRVALIVKYILAENEAYWILLKDIEIPNLNNESFTIYIPRENRLSTINWNLISNYVQLITGNKLDAVKLLNTTKDE